LHVTFCIIKYNPQEGERKIGTRYKFFISFEIKRYNFKILYLITYKIKLNESPIYSYEIEEIISVEISLYGQSFNGPRTGGI
jgi:hypothetical protein